MIVAEHGDYITLYCYDSDEILEFKIGDKSAPSFEKECLGKPKGFKFSWCGENFELQFIAKKQLKTAGLAAHHGVHLSAAPIPVGRNVPDTDIEVHVFYQLTNRCTIGRHRISSITLKCMDYRSNKEVTVNAFYCATCNLYFINHEAIQDLMKHNTYPAINFVIHSREINLRPFSKLMAYGYTVQSDILSDAQRRNILLNIVNDKLMTKQEIIRDLEFKISYNGKRESNAIALSKWRSDLEFISNYTSNNSTSIHGKLIRR